MIAALFVPRGNEDATNAGTDNTANTDTIITSDQGREDAAPPTTDSNNPLDKMVIDPSRPLEMKIPALSMSARFETENCRVKDGAINPDTWDRACTYIADDRPYDLPGTTASDIVVIAGHTGAGIPAVFNDLYDGSKDEHRVAVGDKLYVRTETSGQFWLEYTATDLHEPEKEGLSQSSEIWGTAATPGRLLTISCIQPANLLQSSVRNAVVGWQFTGVSPDPDRLSTPDA